MPTIFNGGNAGIRDLVDETGWKIIAHNRYWSVNTDYAIGNGGNWSFYLDSPASPAGGKMALPLEQGFWEWLLQSSVTEWGLTTYEQVRGLRSCAYAGCPHMSCVEEIDGPSHSTPPLPSPSAPPRRTGCSTCSRALTF